MKFRRINVLLILLAACAGTLHAQDDGAAPAVAAPAAESVSALPASDTAAEPSVVDAQEQSAVPQSQAADPEGQPPTSAGPEFQAAPTGEQTGTGADGSQPAQAGAPQSAVPVPNGAPVTPADDERLRSIFIVASAVVLVGAFGSIIFLLVKRGREERRTKRQYAAEAYLRDLSGSTTETTYKLGSKPVMLGRVGGKDTEFLDYIVVPSATVGRRHALIEFKDFGYWIMDQGSINGTFVNGRPVSSEVRLKHGDRIRLHKLEFEFVMPEVSESSVTVLAHDAARQAAPSASESELVLEPEPDVARSGGSGEMEESLDIAEGEEETLLPGSSAPAPAAQGPADETLLPAGGNAPAPGSEETLLPASGSASRDKTPSRQKPGDGDEFFDITRGT